MKTPKRNQGNGYKADSFLLYGPNQTAFEHARWKRKNRIRQLKHTIKVLTRQLRDTERCLAHTQLSPQKILVIPDHWCDRYTQILKELNQP
jgi:hypothetical protein